MKIKVSTFLVAVEKKDLHTKENWNLPRRYDLMR